MKPKSKPKEKPSVGLWRERPAILVGLLILASVVLWLFAGRGLEGLELKFYDLRINLAAQRHSASSDLVIVAIDDESLKRMEPAVGRWPWPRAVFAGLIDYMSGAASISFDVIFPEADWQFAESDDLFVESVLQNGKVVFGAFIEDATRAKLQLVEEARTLAASTVFDSESETNARVLVPYPALRKAAHALGHVNIFPEQDGVVRRYPMKTVIQGVLYPSLGYQILSTDVLQTRSDKNLDREGFFLLQPYRDRPPVIPAVDVLSAWNIESSGGEAPIDRSVFNGKHVLVGSLATGLQQDRRVTPWGVNVPGVFIAATAVNNMLDGIHIRRVPRGVNFMVLLLVAGLCVAFSGNTPLRQGLGAASLLCVFLCINVLAFTLGEYWIDAVLPSLAVTVFTVYLGMVRWYHEVRLRRRLEALEIAKQEFTDMLVHDLKGRSSSILMAAGMVQEHLGDNDESIKVLMASMMASSQRLVAETSGLLDIRKMTEGQLRIRRQAFPLRNLLILLREQNQGMADIAGTHIQVICDDTLMVTGDQDLLGRILSNLIWNALQHVDKGTDIILKAQTDDQKVYIDVHNQGPVIPPDRMGDLFIPFLSGGTVHMQPGHRRTGLGLTFCKLAVEAHGGKIDVLSPSPEFTSGACFRLILPVDNDLEGNPP